MAHNVSVEMLFFGRGGRWWNVCAMMMMVWDRHCGSGDTTLGSYVGVVRGVDGIGVGIGASMVGSVDDWYW